MKHESVYREAERRTLALSYLISNLFEAESLDACLDAAIKGLSMLGFFQSQISLLEDDYFVVKRNHMNKKYQILLEQMWGRGFLGHKIDVRTSFVSHLLNSKIVATVGIKDAVKVRLEDFIKEYVSIETGASERLGMVTRIASILPKKIDLLMLPLNYHGKVIGAVGISYTSLERKDVLFLQNLCELFAQAFEKVQTKEELVRLSNAMKMSTDSIVISNLDAKIIDVNEATLKMYGTDDKRYLIGKSSFDLIAPEEREKALAGAKEVLEKGYVEGREYHIITKDGGRIPVEMSVAIMKDADGKPIGFVGISRDITERKRAKEALQVSEEKYKNIFESASDCMIYLDRSGRILDVNKKAVEVFAGSKKEILGKHFTRAGIFSFRDIPKLMKNFANILADKKAAIDIHIKNKKGQEIPLECSASLTKTGDKFAGIMVIARDVTERKKREEMLRASERNWSDSFNSLEDVMMIINRDYIIEKINDNGLNLLGKTREEVIGKKCYQVIRGVDAPGEFCPCKKTLKTRKTESVDRHDKLFDKHFSIKSSPIFNERGEIVGFVDLMRDITEHKRAEETLRESEERYRNLFDNARDAIVIFDLKGNVTSTNKAVFAEYGFKEDEFVGKNMLKFVPKKYWPTLLKELAELARGEPAEGEIEIFTPKGKRIADYRSSPIRQGEKVVGFQAVLRDITERKQAEEALKESEERLGQLIEYAPDAIYVNDLKGNFIDGNKQAENMIGYKKDELVGKSFLKLGLLPKRYVPKATKALMKNLLGQKTGPDEFELKRKDGSRVKAEISTFPVKRGGKTEVIGIARDITKRKQMEKKLEEYSQQLEKLVEKRTRELKEAQERLIKSERMAAIGELATMVGHDLRNPLQSIENATYYLNNELLRLPITQKTIEMLQIINDSVNYADKIIRDLQDFSATKKPILKKTNINTVVKETLSQVKAPENVELITELNHLPEIKADKDMIKRVFLNLALNGTQAIEKRGTLKISTKKTRRFVEISFEDTGTGMPKEKMEKIFTPFFTTKAKGMGMGLPICKKFVNAHDGSIEVESEVGEGSTFTVKLPIQQENGGEDL